MSIRQLELFLFTFDAADSDKWAEAATPWLTASERSSAAATADPMTRAQRMVGRAALRLLAASASEDAPAGDADGDLLEIVRSSGGKPRIVSDSSFEFSVSHGLTVVGVAACEGHALGLDIEPIGSAERSHEQLPERLFAASEAEAIGTLDEADRGHEAIRYWTIKEAVGKALGTGLFPAMSEAVIERAGGTLALASVGAEDGSNWTVHQPTSPTVGEVIAIAVHAPRIAMAPIRAVDLEELKEGTLRLSI